jgi:hypothetical protein
MVNPFEEVKWNPEVAERRKFALSLIVGFPCVGLLLVVVGGFRTGEWGLKVPLIIAGCGVALGLLLLALPAIARPFYVVWYAIACAIGLVVGNLLLALVFYVFFTGIGWAMRACRRQPIRKTVDKQAQTYWQQAAQPNDPQQYYKQF